MWRDRRSVKETVKEKRKAEREEVYLVLQGTCSGRLDLAPLPARGLLALTHLPTLTPAARTDIHYVCLLIRQHHHYVTCMNQCKQFRNAV